MTIYKNINRVIVEFKDREGVPSALILENPTAAAYAEIGMSDDALSFDFEVSAPSQDNTRDAIRFRALEDWELKYVRRDEQAGQGVKKKQEFGPVGKVVAGAITVAILVPFIGILWSWAAGVVRDIGGLW